jgi:hypothetical protein
MADLTPVRAWCVIHDSVGNAPRLPVRVMTELLSLVALLLS